MDLKTPSHLHPSPDLTSLLHPTCMATASTVSPSMVMASLPFVNLPTYNGGPPQFVHISIGASVNLN